MAGPENRARLLRLLDKAGVNMVKYNNLIVEQEGAVTIVIINRPKELNALNLAMMKELDSVFAVLEQDTTVKTVILTGVGGKAFVAGADVTEMEKYDLRAAKEWARLGQRVFTRIENFPGTVIAAINGFALGGGCELSMACDIRVASDTAKFGQPEVNLGVTPGFAGTQRLPRLVGKGMAKLLIFSGDIIDAQEAWRIGLVDKVVPGEELLRTAKKLATVISTKAPMAVKQAKLAINRGLDMDLDAGNELEAEIFGLCFTTQDQREGMRAFLEKRKPVFMGR